MLGTNVLWAIFRAGAMILASGQVEVGYAAMVIVGAVIGVFVAIILCACLIVQERKNDRRH
jgi:hypothetical protein